MVRLTLFSAAKYMQITPLLNYNALFANYYYCAKCMNMRTKIAFKCSSRKYIKLGSVVSFRTMTLLFYNWYKKPNLY
ncbi:hypothetical protein BDF21DRAFT_429088 [Thamnidium elegans]|nr:hypothetical protein BDF21DRAFT_429088 [Thamnidium elegans]